MMKKILAAILFAIITTGSFAQQLPFTSQYMFNDYLINPAVGGSLDYVPLSLSIRSQWSGLQGAPETQFFSAHGKLGKKIGIGGYVFNDETGPIKEQGVQFSYSYHLQLGNEAHLSFGLGGMFFSHSISTSKLNFDEPGDLALSNIKTSAVSPDASFGMLYYTKNYKVGISVPQIFQNNLYDNLGSGNQNTLVRHYFIHGEYVVDVNDDFDVVPGTLVKIVSGSPVQFDINGKVLYKKKYWAGVSYRYGESVVTMIGIAYKQFRFGYSYDYTTTDIKDYSSGTHEIFLSFIMGKKEASTAKFQ